MSDQTNQADAAISDAPETDAFLASSPDAGSNSHGVTLIRSLELRLRAASRELSAKCAELERARINAANVAVIREALNIRKSIAADAYTAAVRHHSDAAARTAEAEYDRCHDVLAWLDAQEAKP